MDTAKAHRLDCTLHVALRCVAVVGLLGVLLSPSRAQAADDPWWGKDKQKHLLVSSGAAFVSYLWLGYADLEPSFRMGATALVVLGAGALKEAWDAMGFGHPSWKDMTWNVIGLAVGLAMAWVVERWLWPGNPWAPRWVP